MDAVSGLFHVALGCSELVVLRLRTGNGRLTRITCQYICIIISVLLAVILAGPNFLLFLDLIAD